MFRSLVALSLVTGAFSADDNPPEEPNEVNSIKCTAIALGGAETYSKDAFVEFGVSLGAHLCGDEGYAGVELVAKDVAVAAARAVAATYVECFTEGKDVYGHGEATAHVTASAEAWAGALGQGWASIETCYGCKAAAEVLVQSSKDLFVKAIADSKSELEVYGAADGREKFQYAGQVIDKIEKQVEPVLVKIIAEVQAVIDAEEGEQTCAVRVLACTEVGDNGACCDVTTGAASAAVGTDAIAEAAAGAYAVAYTCGDAQSDAEANAWASAIAEAYAKALAGISGYCDATDNSSACLWAGAQISAYAEAQASAFATAWATAANGCNCEINVDVTTKAFAKIFVEAHAKVGADICVTDGLVPIAALETEIKKATVEAIASAFASAWQDSDSCGGSGGACAEAGSELACCTVNADAYPDDLSVDAIAEANALASGFLCATETAELEAKSEVFVKAIAKAIAVATIDFNNYCESTEKAGFCSEISGWITAHAKAQAQAFASAWAGTPSGCSCEIEAESASKAMEVVYASITADIHKETCEYGEAWLADAGVIEEIAEKSTAAIAKAIAEVKSNGKNCEATAGAGTDVTPDTDADKEDLAVEAKTNEVCKHCVDRDQRCAKAEDTGDSVKGCCNTADVCVRRSDRAAVCKKAGDKAIQRFTDNGFGQILTCPKLNEH